MTRASLAALAFLLAASVSPAAAASNLHPVIVTIRQPAADPALAVHERALRAAAARTQTPVLAMLRRAAARGEAARIRPLWIVDAIAVRASDEVLRELAKRPDVAGIEPDEPVATAPMAVPSAAPAPNIARIGAPALWSRGITGVGVTVASLDTGVDVSDPDLAASFRGGTHDWFDPYAEHAAPVDLQGHGTWTLGVMVGGSDTGMPVGVAPGARWIAARIFDDHGRATASAIHAAFQWTLDPDGDLATADGADVVDAPWAITGAPGCDTTFEPDIQALRAASVLAVFAAGNAGPGAATSVSPANNPGAIAAGAVDAADAVASFSSRGPSACGGGPFPTLTAPGVGIPTIDRHGFPTTADGTSLAAPHVAGALALLLSAHHGLTADQQEAALRAGAVDLGAPGADADYGAGRLDAAASEATLGGAPAFLQDGFEDGTLAAWQGTHGHGLQITPGAALDGSLGLEADGLRGPSYAIDRAVAGALSVRVRLLLEARSLDTSGAWQSVLVGLDGTGARLLDMQLLVGPRGAELRLRVRGARRLRASSVLLLPTGPHAVEVVWHPADRAASLVVDGAALAVPGAVPGVLDRLLLGPSRGHGWNAGTLALDDYASSTP